MMAVTQYDDPVLAEGRHHLDFMSEAGTTNE